MNAVLKRSRLPKRYASWIPPVRTPMENPLSAGGGTPKLIPHYRFDASKSVIEETVETFPLADVERIDLAKRISRGGAGGRSP